MAIVKNGNIYDAYKTAKGVDLSNQPTEYMKNIALTNAEEAALVDDSNSAVDQNKVITNIFRNTKNFKDVTKYKLMRGVPDFGSLVQFNPYETGYACFIICQMPKFIEKLASENPYYSSLMYNWMHIIEYEFKSFEGLDDLSAETIQLGDELNSLNVISKVNMQSSAEFSLTYDEKSGSPLTKFARLYLTGLKDPRTQVKSYHGLIHSNKMDPGFENEVFTFMFITTDNTMREVESAYLLLACQLNSAETSMYNYTKGTIEKKDITVKFSGYPVQSAYVDMVARDFMKCLLSTDSGARQIIINSNNYQYTGLDKATKTLDNYSITSNKILRNKYYPSINKIVGNGTDSYTATNYHNITNDNLGSSN